jgi:hypothetical protein
MQQTVKKTRGGMVKKSHVETNPNTGEKILHCYYKKGFACFDEIINRAYEAHGIEPGSGVQVICKPYESRCIHGMMSADVCHFCRGGSPSKDHGGSLPAWLKS